MNNKERQVKIPKGSNTKQSRDYKRLRRKYAESLKLWDKQRHEFYKEYYAPVDFTDSLKVVTVNKRIGIEDDIDYLAQAGESLIEGNPKEVLINLTNCPRVWPSSVMMFCSFLHWTKLTASQAHGSPRVASTISKHDDVSTYLDFCGFHDYVRRSKTGKVHSYLDESIVKIQRESDGSAFDSRFDEISKLVKEKASFDSDQFEAFQSFILGEIMINVTEHGINYQDKGWYTLTQVHPTSGFISLNIADNGIGFSNSLKTGPQKIKLRRDEDHLYIKRAFKSDVSGAFSASTERKGFIVQRYEIGQRRGNGLLHIRETCKNLGIQLTVISGKGYIQFNNKGKLSKEKSFKKTIFAGTLYSLQIPITQGLK